MLSKKQIAKQSERLEYTSRFHKKEPVSKIAAGMEKSPRTVRRWLARWLNNEGLTDRKKSGRPKKLSPTQERAILAEIPANGRTSSPILLQKTRLANVVGKRTIQRMVKAAGFKVRRATVKPFLTEAHKQARVKFAQEHLTWTEADWRKVCFTDESTFYISSGQAKAQCLVKGKKTELHTVYANKRSAGKVNLFGAIVGSGRVFLQHVPIMNGTSYLEVVKKGITLRNFT